MTSDEPMQAKLHEQLSPADAEIILERLPKRIREALITCATEIEYPVEAVIEMAIASFLDTESIIFYLANQFTILRSAIFI